MVTNRRKPWIQDLNAYEYLIGEMDRLVCEYLAKFHAWVILPDHIHWLVCPDKSDFSFLVSTFKRGVNLELKRNGKIDTGVMLWQDRFWESTVKSENHLTSFTDYVHYNPVKHGHVNCPEEWQHSSIHSYIRDGIYASDWCDGERIHVKGAEYD